MLNFRFFFLKRVFMTLFLSLLSSCNSHSSPWKNQQVTTSTPQFNSSSITYDNKTTANRITLELTQTYDGMRIYLNIASLTITPNKEKPDRANIFITINGTQQESEAFRLQGGQRLLLQEQTRDTIINALLGNKTVTLRVGRYKTDIIPEGFSKLYRSFH